MSAISWILAVIVVVVLFWLFFRFIGWAIAKVSEVTDKTLGGR